MPYNNHPPTLSGDTCRAAGASESCAPCAHCRTCLSHQHATLPSAAAAFGRPEDLFDTAMRTGALAACLSADEPLIARSCLISVVEREVAAALGRHVTVFGFEGLAATPDGATDAPEVPHAC